MPAGTITALRAQVDDPRRVNVFVNGTFAIGVSLDTISHEGLFIGKVLSDADYARLEQAEQADKAFRLALRYLEARPRSIAEIRKRLQQKGYPSLAIDGAIERLSVLGLVDDATFARYWVENRQAYRPRGSSLLRDELRRKGVPADVIATTLDRTEALGDPYEQAMTLARAALRKYAGAPDRATFTRRLGGYLQRRGFGLDLIYPIVEQLWAELNESPQQGR